MNSIETEHFQLNKAPEFCYAMGSLLVNAVDISDIDLKSAEISLVVMDIN